MDEHGLAEQDSWRFLQTQAMSNRVRVDDDRPPRPRRRAHALATSGVDRPMPKLLLLDGHSLAFRAFYALPTDLATPAGTITNAVFGFTSMLAKVLADEQPDYIAVAFDTPGPTFRHEWTPTTRPAARRRPTSSCRSCR